MTEFCGTYTLIESININPFTSATFPGTLNKIVFHTGITSLDLSDVLHKTLCQLIIAKHESGGFTWNLAFDKTPHEGGCLDDKQGLLYRFQCDIDEEFLLTVPISGEKVKSFMKRRGNINSLEQIIYFPNGPVEVVYTKKDTELKISYLHKESQTSASQLFRKETYFETKDSDDDSDYETTKYKSKRYQKSHSMKKSSSTASSNKSQEIIDENNMT